MDNREFFNRMADEYDFLYAARPETEPEDNLVVAYLTERLPAGASILDVGCGTGFFLDKIPWPTHQYQGFDFSARMLARARQKHPRHNFLYADALNGGWPTWQGLGPRWIVALWSVFYWATPAHFFDLYRRYGADAGLVVTATPLLESGFSIDGFEFKDMMPWTSEAVYEAGNGRVTDITPFAYGGLIVPEDEAHYLLVEVH